MVKYKLELPHPTARRHLEQPKVVRIHYHDGWGESRTVFQTIPPGVFETEFEAPDDYTTESVQTANDAPTISAWVTYSNSTGSRTETFSLTPRKVEEK